MTKFLICRHCGNLVSVIHDGGVSMFCCGEAMDELKPNTTEASGEKHLPVVTQKKGTLHVNVGSASHPMTAEHSIQWVYVETGRGGQLRYLRPDEAPEAVFELGEEKATAVYAYCNLHGLWMTKL